MATHKITIEVTDKQLNKMVQYLEKDCMIKYKVIDKVRLAEELLKMEAEDLSHLCDSIVAGTGSCIVDDHLEDKSKGVIECVGMTIDFSK